MADIENEYSPKNWGVLYLASNKLLRRIMKDNRKYTDDVVKSCLKAEVFHVL
jgi:hypothetical protein